MKDIYNSQEARNIAVWLLGDVEVLIEEVQEEFICIALGEAADRYGNGLIRDVSWQLKTYITHTIGKPTYENWLEQKFLGASITSQQLRLGRLNWIADMIAALEKGEALPVRSSLPPGFEWPKPLNVDLRKI